MWGALLAGRQAMAKLFPSHPPIDERVEQLEQMAREMGQTGGGRTGPGGTPEWPRG